MQPRCHFCKVFSDSVVGESVATTKQDSVGFKTKRPRRGSIPRYVQLCERACFARHTHSHTATQPHSHTRKPNPKLCVFLYPSLLERWGFPLFFFVFFFAFFFFAFFFIVVIVVVSSCRRRLLRLLFTHLNQLYVNTPSVYLYHQATDTELSRHRSSYRAIGRSKIRHRLQKSWR